MKWMNEYEVADARRRWRGHPLLGPATETLQNLVDCTNRSSDGWPYWKKPAKAAARLMELIEPTGRPEARFDEEREDVTEADLRAAYRPIKAFLTRQALTCTLVEPWAARATPTPRSRTSSRRSGRSGSAIRAAAAD